ncbi:MAG TPA: vanadium-dependent haloperoxidase [Chitinophagaceae bacterium]|nr:vanadium-dependent haloperoxidase [Chitinophagaceae bacterium]
MKTVKISLAAKVLVFLTVLNFSCLKETTHDTSVSEEATAANGNRPDDPGFAENEMVMYWNQKMITVFAGPRNDAARTRYFAIIQIAVYDALNNIKPKYERFALNDREQFANPDAAVASSAYWAIKGLNQQGNFPIDTWYAESLATVPDGESKELGKTLGKKAADAIIANRANDGFSQVILSSIFPVDGDDPGEYRSTLPSSDPVLNLPHTKATPNWGTVVKPFVLQSNNQFRPAGPYPVNSLEYLNDYNEAKQKGARVGSTRTAEEETLAKFWSDIRKPMVWNNFVRNIIATKKMDAWKTARLFALIHTAMADGINSSMEAKYHFYYWRPETAIRLGDDDGNPNTIGDAAWLPGVIALASTNPLMHVYTPTVPEYPSSFAIDGGAITAILQSFFGSDEISIDFTSAMLPEVTLHYSSIVQAVRDNSLSKIYAGWYFRKAVLDGEEMGRNIGSYVFNHNFRESGE